MFAFTFLGVFLMAPSSAEAQQAVTISGKVIDADGNPLIGSTVMVKNTTLGTTTNLDGDYSFTVSGRSEFTLTASYIGYSTETKDVVLTDETELTINFTLADDVLGFGELVVTGVANKKSKLESSVSVSTIDIDAATLNSAPRSTSEIFRTIPGVRSEASAGEGNTNITVRGVPISAGGSKYLQLQEDGLPLLLFGDIAFATADIFLRADQTVARIEALRGGSASTLASNSPAGVINFISKNGSVAGGSIATGIGMDYDNFRTDFEYGAPVGENLSFHIGGFFREGEGQRTAGYSANNGGQIKANLTKNFDKGYARVYVKYLNDRTAAYMPMPLQVSGTNANPTWGSIPGFNGNYGTPHTAYLQQNLSTGPDGGLRRSSLAEGMNPQSSSFGAEFAFELGDGWSVENRSRMSFIGGGFVTPFPAELGTPQALAESVGGPGSRFVYAGTNTNFNPSNGLAMRMHLFDVDLNDFNNFFNDLKITKSINDKIDFTAGFFRANQNISMSWLWNSYMMEVNGENARLLDVVDADDNVLSEQGLYAYGTPAWGNLHRNFDTNYSVSAPYVAFNVQATEALTIDASLRMDMGRVRGSFAGGSSRSFDMNNDGNISAPEQDVYFIDQTSATTVNYDYNYLSYSVGANFMLNDNQAVFGRVSQGYTAKSDRLLFQNLDYTNGDQLNSLDGIFQAEVGYKHRLERGGIFVTAFLANTTEEGGFEATTQEIIENDYQAFGVELEGTYNFGDFDIRGGLTWTEAEISSGANQGNAPRRQPGLMYNIIPSYSIGKHVVGMSLIGQTKAYAQDNNELVMPGYFLLNAFTTFTMTENLSLTLSANNLTNSLGITESEEGSIVNNQVNFVRARPIPGRTVLATFRYNF